MAYAHREHPGHEGYDVASAAYHAAKESQPDREAAYREALVAIREAHGEFSPPVAAATYYLASYIESVDPPRATRWWLELLATERGRYGLLHTETAGTLNNLGLHHQRLGRFDEMEILVRWSAEVHRRVDDEWTGVWWNLGRVLQETRQPWRALRVLRVVAREAPADRRGRAFHAIARGAERLGLEALATESFDAAIDALSRGGSDEERCNAQHNRALYRMRLGHYEQALADFEVARRLERARSNRGRSYAITLRARVRALLQLGRFAAAEAAADEALAIPFEHDHRFGELRERARRRERAGLPAPLEVVDPAMLQLEELWDALDEGSRRAGAKQLMERAGVMSPEARRLYADRYIEVALGEGSEPLELLEHDDAVVRAMLLIRLGRFDAMDDWLDALARRAGVI